MPIHISNKKLYSTKEAADQVGRSRDTVLRWIRSSLFPDVERDGNNNRIWVDEDIENLKKLRDELLKKKLLRGVK